METFGIMAQDAFPSNKHETGRTWVVLQIGVPFEVPSIVRHPYKRDPKRDHNLENYPYKS